eukprot:4401781-Amphidinium_carterae.2
MKEVLQEKLQHAMGEHCSSIELEELVGALETAKKVWPDSALNADGVAKQLDKQRKSDILQSFRDAVVSFCDIGDDVVQESDVDAMLQKFPLVARYKVNGMAIEGLGAEMKSLVLKALKTLVHSFTKSKSVTSDFLAGLVKIAEAGQVLMGGSEPSDNTGSLFLVHAWKNVVIVGAIVVAALAASQKYPYP